MAEKNNNTRDVLPERLTLEVDLRGNFEAKLRELWNLRQGIPCFMGEEGPIQEVDQQTAIAANYRSAIMEQLLEKGVVFLGDGREIMNSKLRLAPYSPVAYRKAYVEVLEHLEGLKKLSESKPDESQLQ